MRIPKVLISFLLVACLGLTATQGRAQGLTVQIVNGVPSAIPITVVPFGQIGSGPSSPINVAAIVSMDLNRCGKFRTLPTSEIVQSPTKGSEIKFGTWQQLKQAYIVVGRTSYHDGVLKADFELWDVNKQQQLLGLSITGRGSDLRRVAHQIADRIYKKIIGVRGAFDTRIAYVTQVGLGKSTVYSLVVADSDGYNPQTVVRSHEPLLSPAWSPNGKELAYVSFESGNSAIYIQNIATGSRRVVSARKGSINGAPRFSPNGKKLAVALSFQGNEEIYILDFASGKLTRLTHNLAIDTEPRWMPNGKDVIFTSDRSGKPQLYEIPVTGGTPQRLTFQGEYNADAAINYNGKKIAMVQGNGNVYRIAVMDFPGGHEIFVSPGNLDDSPSWAPNGSMLLYSADEGKRSVLYAVSADGRVRQRLMLASGSVQSPIWGPYRNP